MGWVEQEKGEMPVGNGREWHPAQVNCAGFNPLWCQLPNPSPLSYTDLSGTIAGQRAYRGGKGNKLLKVNVILGEAV